jgi:hypothetical protein
MGKYKKHRINIFEYAKTEDWIPDLEPIRLSLPEWWKDSDLWVGGSPKIEGYGSNKGLKACVPFLDSMLYGYTIKLWTDCMVEFKDNNQVITWMNMPDPINLRNKDTNNKIPVPVGCGPEHFVWNIPYYFKTPNGYSLLITHPFNRNDLPFVGLTGLVDSDSTMYPGKYPFFLKNNFQGIIPAGTPIAQVVPIKRDNWKIKENKELIKEGEILKNKSFSLISGFYKKNIHKKKIFE